MTAVCKFLAIMAIGGRRLFPKDWRRRGGNGAGGLAGGPMSNLSHVCSRVLCCAVLETGGHESSPRFARGRSDRRGDHRHCYCSQCAKRSRNTP